MKQLLIILVLNLSIPFCVAQCPTSIHFTEQGQVDAFVTAYPECTAIPGDVFISGNVYSLMGLSTLISIGGNFQISYSKVSNMNGMEGLTFIGNHLIFWFGQGNLNDLKGLSNLKTIGGSLMIGSEWSLTNLDGLENIKTLKGLILDDNKSLTDLKGLKNLESVIGQFKISATSVTSLKGFESLSLLQDDPEPFSSSDRYFEHNPNLSECAIPAICNILDTDNNSLFFGSNAIGCKNRNEVQAQCLLLPVTLVSFKALNENGNVVLSWITSEEKNSELYEIQRSRDGKSWSTIGKVHAGGESNEVRHYNYTDIYTMYGENLYRLKMVDLDESFAYSRIISVTSNKLAEVVPYPNPITENRVFFKTGRFVEGFRYSDFQ
jgi:hypothetical protein